MRLKYFICNISIIVVLMFMYAGVSFANESTVQLVINSQVIQTDAPPITVNGSSMVSLSSLDQLQLHLKWDAKEKKVTVSSVKNNAPLILKVGDNTAQFGSKSLQLQAPPILKNNRVMVPLRFISEVFGAQVIWNSQDRMVMIHSADQIKNYKDLYQEKDLVTARKIAVDLPSPDKNVWSSTDEEITYMYRFPEGQALRYYYFEGNQVSYYEINNDVKHLIWEAIVNDTGQYNKERGKRPIAAVSTVYFRKHRIDNSVDYGRLNDKKVYTGEASNGTLAQIIMKIPNEVRTDLMQPLR